jgi:hypothetical protein
MPMIWAVAALIAILNLPFGYWRAGQRKLSPSWFAAVHLPVPLAIGIRFASGIGFQWRTLPLFVVAYFGGQWLGGKLRSGGGLRRRHVETHRADARERAKADELDVG